MGAWGPTPKEKGTQERKDSPCSIGALSLGSSHALAGVLGSLGHDQLMCSTPPPLHDPGEHFPEATYEDAPFCDMWPPETRPRWRMLAQRQRKVMEVLTVWRG